MTHVHNFALTMQMRSPNIDDKYFACKVGELPIIEGPFTRVLDHMMTAQSSMFTVIFTLV